MVFWFIGLCVLLCIWESKYRSRQNKKRDQRIEELKRLLDNGVELRRILANEDDIVVQVKLEEYQKHLELKHAYKNKIID